MQVAFSEAMGMAILANRCLDPEMSAKVRGSLVPGDVFIDIGANRGYYTLLASRVVGATGMVLTFEPNIQTLKALANNLALNRCSNVVLFSQALSDCESISKLSIPPISHSGLSSLRAVGEEFTLAPVCRLDNLLSWFKLTDRVRIVKIDTEGFELQTLRGMGQLLHHNRRLQILCELSPEWYRVDELINYLDGFGFTGQCFEDGGWRPLNLASLPQKQCNAWFSRP
jgi:FkbM family methyltransferase